MLSLIVDFMKSDCIYWKYIIQMFLRKHSLTKKKKIQQ